ncbi:MAG: hypothetical protein ACRDNZ_06315, partial [Streptosporangiaceae bacterium]
MSNSARSRGRMPAALMTAVAAVAATACASAAPATPASSVTPASAAGQSSGPAAPPPAATKPAKTVASPGRYPPGNPYLVLLSQKNQAVTVRDQATGAVTGTVAEPGAGYQFFFLAAAPDDREFILAAQPLGSVTKPIRFYVLRLDAAGHPGPPSLLPSTIAVSGQDQIYSMAVSNGGTELAVLTFPQPIPAAPASRLWVFGLGPSGGVRSWINGADGISPFGISFDDAGQLGFAWANTTSNQGDGLRILSAESIRASPAGSLLTASRMAVPGHGAGSQGTQLTLDGST